MKELYNARVSKLSPQVLAMMNTETTAKSKAEELYRPSEVTAKFEQVVKAAIQKINQERDRSLGRIVLTRQAGQSPIRKEKPTNPTEPAGPVPSEAKVRSRVVDIRKDLNTRSTFEQVAAEHPRAYLNGMTRNPAAIHQPVPTCSQHSIIGDSLVRDLNQILVGGQTTVISFGGASVAQVIKMMQLQNDDRVDALTVMIRTNDVSRNPITPEAKWESRLICLLNELKENYRPTIVVLYTIPINPDAGSPVADFMNGNVTQWNVMIRNLTRGNPNELSLVEVENTLRMVDHGALTKDGIHLNTQPRIQWINDAFQTRIEEMEAELRTTVNPVTQGSPAGRVRSHIPQALVNRLGPLTTEANVVQPSLSSDVRERLVTAPAPRGRFLENCLGTRSGPQQVAPQVTANTAAQHSRASPAQRTSRVDPVAVIDTSRVSELLWKKADPSPWGRYRADMAIKLSMKTLTCRADARRMLIGVDLTVSGLYRIAGVDWLLAEKEQYRSATTLQLVDLEGLPGDNTMGPLNTMSMTDVRHQVRERAPQHRRGNFLVENRPNNRHHKIGKQFAKPPRQTAGEYSRKYPRITLVKGDGRRSAHLESPKGDNLFAACDTQEIKLGRILIVAGCDFPHSSQFGLGPSSGDGDGDWGQVCRGW